MKITKKACEDLFKAPPPALRSTHWDDALAGFGLRHGTSGSMAFILKYRVKGDARQRVVTLGEYPALNPDRARATAAQIKADAGLRIDTVAQRIKQAEEAAEQRRQAQRRALPLVELLDLWRGTVEAAAKVRAAKGESTEYERMLLRLEGKAVRPQLKNETVASFDPNRLQALIHLQTSHSVANNVRAVLVRFVRFANAEMTTRGLPLAWPTRFEVPGKGRVRSSQFTVEQAARIWITAGRLGRRGALIRFMLLTACRRVEAQKVQWDHIVLDDPITGPNWRQPAHLTKNHQPHRVPLSEPAVALLRWLPVRETKKAGESALIFAGRGGKPVGSWTRLVKAMRDGAGLDTGTLHDFRRTIVTALGDAGFDPQVADALLNHAAATTMGGVMSVYQRSELWMKRREAINCWTRLLMAAVERILQQPMPSDWGFSGAFEDARIAAPQPAAKPGRAKRQAA